MVERGGSRGGSRRRETGGVVRESTSPGWAFLLCALTTAVNGDSPVHRGGRVNSRASRFFVAPAQRARPRPRAWSRNRPYRTFSRPASDELRSAPPAHGPAVVCSPQPQRFIREPAWRR